MTEFNITLKELKRAAKYAEKHGYGDNKAIRLTFDNESGIGNRFKVCKINGKKVKDITDVGSW